jgi:hypothetical protein
LRMVANIRIAGLMWAQMVRAAHGSMIVGQSSNFLDICDDFH